MNWFLLFLSLLPSPLVEEVLLSDGSTIQATYNPSGTVLFDEGMLISVEDFVHLSTEMNNAVHACDIRLNLLEGTYKEELDKSQKKCRDRNQINIKKIMELEAQTELLKEKRKTAQTETRIWQVATISTAVLSVTVGYLVLK